MFPPASLPVELDDLYRELVTAENKEEKAAAAKAIINEYYRSYGKATIRQDMWKLLSAALGNPHAQNLMNGNERNRMICFYEFTLMLLDAVEEYRNTNEADAKDLHR